MVEFIAELPDDVFKNILHKNNYPNHNSKFSKGFNHKGYGKHACYSPLIHNNVPGELGLITPVRGSNNISVTGSSTLFNDCLTEVFDGDCALNNDDIRDYKVINTNNRVNIDKSFVKDYNFDKNDFKDCECDYTSNCVLGDCLLNNYASKDCVYNNTNIHVSTDKAYYTNSDVNANNTNIEVDCTFDNARVGINSKGIGEKLYSKDMEVIVKDLRGSPESAVSSTANAMGEVACQAALHEADLASYNGNDMDFDLIDVSDMAINCTFNNDDVYIHDVFF
jgi:hypothetical protein